MELLFDEDTPTISTQPKIGFHDELTQYLNSGMSLYSDIFKLYTDLLCNSDYEYSTMRLLETV